MEITDRLGVVFLQHQSDVGGIDAPQICVTRVEIRTQGVEIALDELPTLFQK